MSTRALSISGYMCPRHEQPLTLRHASCGDVRYATELLSERGVTVHLVSIYRWVRRFTPGFIEAARLSGMLWVTRSFAGEMYIKAA